MNEHDPIDLSPLDPMRDPERWRALADATLERLEPTLAARRRQDPLTLIAGWSRHVVAGAVVAVAILAPLELALELREDRAEQVQRLVDLSGGVAPGEDPPTGDEFVRALGGEGGPR